MVTLVPAIVGRAVARALHPAKILRALAEKALGLAIEEGEVSLVGCMEDVWLHKRRHRHSHRWNAPIAGKIRRAVPRVLTPRRRLWLCALAAA
jgi:hypothetical protein